MMRTKTLVMVLALVLAAACASMLPTKSVGTVLYAQTVPATLHATWTPSVVDATHSAPTQYVLTLDNGTSQTVAASTCTPAQCSATIAVPSFGNHAVSVVATSPMLTCAVAGSCTDSTLQTSPAATITFTLNQAPAAVSGVAVAN